MISACRMVEQGYPRGKCDVELGSDRIRPACEVALRRDGGVWHRVVRSAHLSRPEHYFSIYCSLCNHHCLKCHSWNFSQHLNGHWMSTDEIADLVLDYEEMVTVWEPKERATMWHASDLCRSCGVCKTSEGRGRLCPQAIEPDKVVLSPQGWGPARNIAAFTGGDLICRTEFYAEAAKKIHKKCSEMHVLLETNGYGLTSKNLEELWSAGVTSFWLDIKAYDEEVYRRLCGTTNEWILQLPSPIIDMGYTLEVLTLYIPGWVETGQIEKIAQHVAEASPEIPFTLLAFFPAYKLADNRAPTLIEMLEAYFTVKAAGLSKIKLGNLSVFTKTPEEWSMLIGAVGKEAL